MQGSEKYILHCLFFTQVEVFVKNAQPVCQDGATVDANAVDRHVIDNVKQNGSCSLKIKVQIALQGNEDSAEDIFINDCTT